MTEPCLPGVRPAHVVRGLVGLLLALTTLTSLPLPAATAAATPGGLRATAVTPATVSLAWKAVARAPKYRVQYATRSSMADARYRRFSEPRGQLGGLQPGVTYYVKVRVITTDGKNLSPYSAAVKVRTTAATPTRLRVTAVTPTTASYAWNPVTDAPRYRLQYARSSTMKGAVYRRSTGPQARLAGLQPRVTYYVKVRVITADGRNLSPYSAAVKVRTQAGTPTGLQATPVDPTTVALLWKPVPEAPEYAVQYAEAPSMAGASVRRSAVPRAELSGLRADTTYYVRVRVVTSSGATLSPYSATAVVRTANSPLRVASYNVRCANCFVGLPDELPWAERREAVVASVLEQDLDVLGVQEASQGWLKGADGKVIDLSQFEDVRQLLGAPWKLTNDKRNNCVRHKTPTRCEYQNQGASRGTRILYNSARVELLSGGSKLLGAKADGSSERFLAWAVLRQRSTGKKFLFANSHLEDDADQYALRKSEAEVAVDTITAVNPDDLPVIAVGDWNSSRFADPTNGPYDAYRAAGFVDPLGTVYDTTRAVNPTVERTVNVWLNSFNGFVRRAKGHRTWGTGSYIDYMLTTPMRVSEWETVAQLDATDSFVGVIPSDHNMIRMTVYLPR